MIELVEVAPRDGLQNEPELLSTDTKVELVAKIIGAGVKRIEVTSFVNPKRVPQMADAEQVMAALPREDGVSYIGLVLNQRGFERAVKARCDEVNFVVVASDTFNRKNQGMSTDQTLSLWADIARAAKSEGIRSSATIAAAFGCPFEGEIAVKRVAEIAAQIFQSGPDEIALADTIGVGVPSQVAQLVNAVADAAPEVPLRCHFHNTRNTGIANAAAAVAAGVKTLDASVGGIGGCPFAPSATGNIPSEDLIYMLDRMGVRTGVDGPELIATAKWLADELGRDVPGLLHRAGYFPAALT